ncbi:MAG: hypothetical protein ACJAQ3_002089, partial [Planctomycetota bacterium]
MGNTPPPQREPGILDSGEVARVHRDVIARIRRVLERSGLNPLQLG